MLFRQIGAFPIGATIAKSAKPLIEREDTATVVAFKIPVMQVVKIAAGRYFFVHQWSVEAMMPMGGPQDRMLHGEKGVDRMGGHDPMDANDAKVEQGFHRVHRHP